MSKGSVVLIGCSVFEAEIEALCAASWPGMEVRLITSMLHMEPGRLEAMLREAVDEALAQGQRVVLLYGDCCPRMADIEAMPGVARTQGANCCQLLMGRETWRRLSREGAFFLPLEWLRRWREVFEHGLGLHGAEAPAVMGVMNQKLVYLDSGLVPPPVALLEACAEFCGLPVETLAVSLEPLKASIQEALDRLQARGLTP